MRWTPEEDARLRELYVTHTRAEIADLMRRTEGMVRSRCWTLRLVGRVNPKSGKTMVPKWSARELELLRRWYTKRSGPLRLDRLAKKLGRNEGNISRKARSLGLTDAHRKKGADQQVIDFTMRAGSPELSERISTLRKRWLQTHEHPRGMLGKTHSEETKRKASEHIRQLWRDPAHRLNSPELRQRRSDILIARVAAGQMRAGGFTRCAGGRRADLGDTYFRSAWEANYARYLNWRKTIGDLVAWEYECKTFVFEQIKRGTRAYTPDFKVTFPDGRHEWHEVKGWMDQASRTRLDRMAKFFPEETVRVIDETWFKMANREGLCALIPNWEGRRR